jgi:hypothetical protein
LAICQVADELAEFISAVDEIRVVDNFAKNEGIFLGCRFSHYRKGFIYADWRNAKWRNACDTRCPMQARLPGVQGTTTERHSI